MVMGIVYGLFSSPRIKFLNFKIVYGTRILHISYDGDLANDQDYSVSEGEGKENKDEEEQENEEGEYEENKIENRTPLRIIKVK